MRTKFLNNLQTFLYDKEYCIMKNLGQTFVETPLSSDLDLLVSQKCKLEILHYIQLDQSIEKIKITKLSYMYIVKIFFKDFSFLSVDLIFEFKRHNTIYLNAEEILQHSMLKNGCRIPQIEDDLEYILLFYFLNFSEIPVKYLSYFLNLDSKIQNDFNQKMDTLYSINNFYMAKFSNFSRRNILNKVKRRAENLGLNRISNAFIYTIDFIKRKLFQKGIIISFTGVDGAGKSTIIEITTKLLEEKYREKVIYLRHRPSFLPILSAIKHGKIKAEQISVSNLPRKGKNFSFFSSLFRFGYYYIDFLFGGILIYFKYVLSGYIVVYDRYYYDFIVDGIRSNIRLPRFIPIVLYFFIYKPGLNFLLIADSKIILKRKQELSENDILYLTTNYVGLFKRFATNFKNQKYIIIDNVELNLTIKTIENQIVKNI